MQKIQNLKLIFKNKNNLFSNITKNIYNLNGRILYSKYNHLDNHSELDMNISIPKKNINIFNNYLLDMNINTTKNVENILFKVKIYCSDNPGIIHSACEEIEKLSGQIIKMNTKTTKSPITSIDLFELETLFLVKNIYSIRDIECHLNGIKETYNCELNVSII